MSGFTFFAPNPPLADIVEITWDVDLPDADWARAMTFTVLPAISPTLCVHYRAAADSNQRLNPGNLRQRVTGVQTGAITIRPTGPVGAVIVHLKPQAAYRFMGGQMNEFTDANVGLCDLFSPPEVSLLEEMLAQAASATERVTRMQDFLMHRLRTHTPDAVVHQAVVELRRTPNLQVHRLAPRLEISERQLSRRFHAIVGTSVKQFARVARWKSACRATAGVRMGRNRTCLRLRRPGPHDPRLPKHGGSVTRSTLPRRLAAPRSERFPRGVWFLQYAGDLAAHDLCRCKQSRCFH